MSVFYNTKLISGVREVPHLTQSEYDALTNKPDLWVRTDAPDSDRGISVSDIEDALYIKKGANDLTDCILFGVITGNGQNADVIIPCSYDSSISGITSVSLNVNAGIFSSNDVVYVNSINTSGITVSKTKVGLRLRIPFTTTVTANKPCVVVLNSANSITFN